MFGGSDRRELTRYTTIAQVGLEMAVPPGLGALVDAYFGVGPWGVVVGAVLGLIIGLLHLVQLVNREESATAEQRRAKQPPDGAPDKESRLP
jgi:F0F1-type ATP synthase assembly protein I